MVVATQVNVAGVWKDLVSIEVNVAGVWKEVDEAYCNVGAVWKTVYVLDVVNLQSLSADELDEGGGGATATCRCYNGSIGDTFRAGEGWESTEGSTTYSHDIIFPGTSADDYQLKWESNAGSDPTTSVVVKNTWHPLSTSNFWVEWDTPSEGHAFGSVLVSIRKGTGATLDTAIWYGDAESFLEDK